MPDSEPVRLWRDFARLNLSASWKSDVDKTVTDLELWRELLANWKWKDRKGKWHRKSPAIKPLLDAYERIKFDRLEAANGNHEASVVSARGRERVSERGDSTVREVRSEAPSLYFRTREVVR